MNLIEFFDLVNRGEGPHLEFKRKFPNHLDNLAKTMSAFANCGGGTLLIGVNEDNGEIVGIPTAKDADDRMRTLSQLARNCSPPLFPEIGSLKLDNIFVVYAKVQPIEPPPCNYKGTFYVRVGTITDTATPSDLQKLLANQNIKPQSQLHKFPANMFSPPPLKSFKGRDEEIKRLSSIFDKNINALIIVEGISGIGKTSLLARFSKVIEEKGFYPFWFECREETSFDSISMALSSFSRSAGNDYLADLIDNIRMNPEERISGIAASLAASKYALFFDDYHLVTDSMANRLLQKTIERADENKILMTCRLRPKLASTVKTFSFTEFPLTQGLDFASCSQFLKDAGLDLTPVLSQKIWELTGFGHPKALEIFISLSRTFPVSELLSTLPVFQEEIKNSWLTPLLNDLPDGQRELAIDLSVFDRSIPFQAMTFLHPDKEIYLLIGKLVDRFILDRVDENLLRMHPLIREYCYSLISDKKAKHLWAATYYLNERGEVSDLASVTDIQIDAGICAWSHLVKAEESQKATKELDWLRKTLMNRGQYEQAMFLIDQTPLPSASRDWYAIHKARMFSLWGDLETSVSLITPLLKSNDVRICREAILVLATILFDSDQAEKAKAVLESNHLLFLKNVTPVIRRRFLKRLVEINIALGEHLNAENLVMQMVQSCHAEGDEVSGAVSLRQLAIVCKSQGKNEMAISFVEQSIELLKKHQRNHEIALSEKTLASIFLDSGDRESSLLHLQAALQMFEEMGDRKNSFDCRHELTLIQSAHLLNTSEKSN